MWTPDALRSNALVYRGEIWRVVETQYKAATMRLTDTLGDQAILERILERSKPPIPANCAGLDFLLATPFRYAPYPEGSRFRRANQPEGAFYASEEVETAIAETAFHRLLFFAESPAARLPSRAVEHTAFSARCETEQQIDLTTAPLDADRAIWTHPVDYEPCQSLADGARKANIEIIRYESVRDPKRRANIALLSPRAFARPRPIKYQTWHIFPRPHAVQAWREFPESKLEYQLADFSADPRLATFAARL